jgi:hypothetical protein
MAHVLMLRNNVLLKGLACKATAAMNMTPVNPSALDIFMAGLSNHDMHGR